MSVERYTLIHIISSNKWGGAQRYALDICSHFHQQGWDVSAATRDARVVDDHFRRHSIPLIHAPLRGFFDPASAWIMARHLRDTPRDKTFVHVHRYRDAFTVFLAKRIAKRPDIRIISTRHTIRRARNSALFRRIYAKINAHIFVSKVAFEKFASTWADKLPMQRHTVHILLNSIPDRHKAVSPEPERGPICALYLGPLVAGKGIETIIDALVSLRDLKIRLRIAGHGNPDYLDDLRRRAMSRGVMEMIDWKINPEVSDDIIDTSHFAVLPSIEREAFGLQNLRVMAAARPQICSPSGAQSEYLEDGTTAIFVPPAEPPALAEKMRQLATDPDLRRTIGDAARSAFEKHLSWNPFITHLKDIYLSC